MHSGFRTRGTAAKRAVPLAIVVLFIAVFGVGLFAIAKDGHPLSVVDEHIHFDTAVKASHGELPYRGSLLGEELLDEWACGVGHEGGAIPYPCGDPRVTPDAIPSGKYSTGYGHYPTYFFAAAGFQTLYSAVTSSDDPLEAFRVFSALTLLLGVLASAVLGWLLGMRGARLIAVTAVPVASSMIVFAGTIVNPTSTSVLMGALIGGTGLIWMRRGKGFLWFALSVGLASSIAVTVVLPAGGFGLVMLASLIWSRSAFFSRLTWRPRWWQLLTLAALILGPVIGWGRFIAARATVERSPLRFSSSERQEGHPRRSDSRDIPAAHTVARDTRHPGSAGNLPRAHRTRLRGRCAHLGRNPRFRGNRRRTLP